MSRDLQKKTYRSNKKEKNVNNDSKLDTWPKKYYNTKPIIFNLKERDFTQHPVEFLYDLNILKNLDENTKKNTIKITHLVLLHRFLAVPNYLI